MNWFLSMVGVCCGLMISGNAVATSFGNAGQSGQSGWNGRDGASARAVSVVADGRVQSIDAEGERGERGDDGDAGYPASGCYQPREAYNVQGAPGGQGGMGGHGGHGGNGGNVTVYYSIPEDLRALNIYASPGRGGASGYGGRGADGCRCQVYQWQVGDQTYYCTDGSYGYDGNAGNRGLDGDWGTLAIIPQLEPLPAQIVSLAVSPSELLSHTQALSEHQWLQKSQASRLFAPGSRVPSTYFEYQNTFAVDVTGTWSFSRPAEDFDSSNMVLRLNDKVLTFEAPEGVWLDAEVTQDANAAHIEVTHAIYQREVKALSFERFSGSGRALTANLVDSSGQLDDIATSFSVRYYSRGLVFMRLRYEGAVDANLVAQNGDQFAVNLGGLPIDSDFLGSGESIYVELYAKRQSGSRDLTLAYEINHRIP